MAEASAPVDSTPIATVTQAPTLVIAPLTQAAPENNSGEMANEALTTIVIAIRASASIILIAVHKNCRFTTACTLRHGILAVQLVKGSILTDLMAYVQTNEANVQAMSPGYKQVYLKASTASTRRLSCLKVIEALQEL